MNTREVEVNIVDFALSRPAVARILIAQASWNDSHWKEQFGLYFHADLKEAQQRLEVILAQARQATVDMVLLPELSVPEECLQVAQNWTDQTGSIVIAGSHYTKTKRGFVARSPIIVAGKVFFTEKIVPAPAENSPISGEGLQKGRELTIFRNSSVGNFGVLICSDYLDLETKQKIQMESLDLLCVPAFQRDSSVYHTRMSIDCEESSNGIYIAYANTKCGDFGDGRSAFFGLMDTLFLSKLQKAHFTDANPSWKICELDPSQSYMVVEIDLISKKPYAKRTVHTKPNVTLVDVAGEVDIDTEKFLQAIGHHDERYAKIKSLYVPPREYEDFIDILERARLLFIIGDPGIGKTYSAARLLRYYFDEGFYPVWYSGLERDERLAQRQILENFKPQSGQVLYFEDPFGRTVFEQRDTIKRLFGPLLDHLKEVNARIIITSRRQVFERFAQTILFPVDLTALTEDLNVVKPSYSPAALERILNNLAVAAKWYNRESCRDLVTRQIRDGRLTTPLAIRDFVFSTETVDSESVLIERLQRRGAEEKALFAEEIEASPLRTKLTLSLVFLFGSQTVATLSSWFNRLAGFLEPAQSWSGTSPLFEELRIQLGYRIEQYGIKATVLRFIHPSYEEAFALTAEKDPITLDVISNCAQFVARTSFRASSNSITRLWRKYPDLANKLLTSISPILKAQDSLTELSMFGLSILNLELQSNDPRLIELMLNICKPQTAVDHVNKSSDLQAVGHGLRFCFNYFRRLTLRGTISVLQERELIQGIRWKELIEKWKDEAVFSRVLDSLEWAHFIDGRVAGRFLKSMTSADLLARFASLTQPEKLRFLAMTYHWSKGAELREMLGATAIVRRGKLYPSTLFEDVDRGIGIVIDEGALTALRKGYNLLPVGIIDTRGNFDREEVVSIFDYQGIYVGAGITFYDDEDVQKIKGHHSSLIAQLASHDAGKNVMRGKSAILLHDTNELNGASGKSNSK